MEVRHRAESIAHSYHPASVHHSCHLSPCCCYCYPLKTGMFARIRTGNKIRQRVVVGGTAALVLLLWVVMSAQFLRGASNAVNELSSTPLQAKKMPWATKSVLPSRGSLLARHPASSQGTHATCGSRGDCLACLYGKDPLGASIIAVPSPIGDCVWCANERRCVPSHPEISAKCDDVEDAVCPSVLVARVPQNHRVIHVGIRKGGPEALVQLHLALNHWGFNTSLDTRKSMKEKGGPVMPFFLEVYKDEFAKAPPLRWVKNYDDWHQSAREGDVLIATETWVCKNDPARYLPSGVRQMQWHLTVWPRRDRSQCTVAGHTNYVTRDYMKQSTRALMYPYISPHIVALAASKSWKRQKEDIVLYDSDTHLKDSDLEGRRGVARTPKIATGYTPQQLYALYGRAKAGIDLQLPGGERFIYEAALFDVCVIVDDAMNGGDREDFPIPERFRVPAKNIDALNEAVDGCIRDYDAAIAEFGPLKQLVLKQHVTFLRQVRRYYSNSVHISSVLCSQEEMDAYGARFLLATFLQVPFAVVELFMPRGVTMDKQTHLLLSENSFLAAVFMTELHQTEFNKVCGGGGGGGGGSPSQQQPSSAHRMLQAATSLVPRTNRRRSLMTVWLAADSIIMSEDIMHSIVSQLVLEQRAVSTGHETYVKGTPCVVYSASIAGTASTVSKNSERETSANEEGGRSPTHVFMIAVLSQHMDALHRITCDEAANAGSTACRYQRNKVDITAGRLTAAYPAEQLERIAQHIAMVDSRGSVVWGVQQAIDEVVAPFLCTHELWRRVVVQAKVASGASSLGCR